MAPPPSAPTQTRPREEEIPEAPAAKRPKTIVEKLAFGQLYNEIDWMSLNPTPITLNVQLPTSTEKPEWTNKLNGSILAIEDVAVNTPFSAIRERIKRALDADLPISRMRIEYEGRVMNNASSLASVNIGEGDLVTMTLKKK
jgi:splicing factor 3A subunit 1